MHKPTFLTVDPGWRVFAGVLALAGCFCCFTLPASAQSATPIPAGQPAPAPQPAPMTAQPAAMPPAAAANQKPKPPDKKAIAAAQAAFQAGSKAFEAGDYATAQAEFQKAHTLAPTPVAQYWIAVSIDKGDASQAQVQSTLTAYEAFLAMPNVDKAGSEKLEAVKARITELRAGLDGFISIVTNPAGAAISVDGVLQQATTPAVLNLKPGAHKISLTLAGYEQSQVDVTVAPEQKQDHSLELVAVKPPPPPPVVAPPPPPPPPAPEPEAERSLVPAYVTLLVAGGSAVVGTIFGVQALGAKSDFDAKPTTDNADSVERNALIADMAFGVAVTLGVTGIVLLTSDEPEPEQAKAKVQRLVRARLDVAPYASPTGGGARAQLTF